MPNTGGLKGYYVPDTLPHPALEISGSKSNVLVTLPGVPINFILQTTTNSSASTGWSNVPYADEWFGVKTNVSFPATNRQQYFRLKRLDMFTIPLFQLSIFFNGLLEFTWNATLTVNGRVHANGNIFVGSSSDLTFNNTVTCTGVLVKTNWDGHTVASMTGNITYAGTPGYSTNTQALPIFSGGSTPSDCREIINQPPAGETLIWGLAYGRYYYKAGVVLLISNSTVTAMFKSAPGDNPTVLAVPYVPTDYAGVTSNFPFLSLSNTFTDGREARKTVKVTQIDIGKLDTWLRTNQWVLAKFPPLSPGCPNVLYVADNRTTLANELAAIRLSNAAIIPTNMTPQGPTGFTVATPNPLYIWGNYNCPDPAALGSTNTSSSFPASLVCDALTILSPGWNDAVSGASLSSRRAVTTTVNAAILAGMVYSTGPDANSFSGGVVNLPRLLEDWTGNNLWLNTSLVNLFNSARATNQFQSAGVYYYAPTRRITFDANFTNPLKLPPGAPSLGYIIEP